jgi:hypothetical protein
MPRKNKAADRAEKSVALAEPAAEPAKKPAASANLLGPTWRIELLRGLLLALAAGLIWCAQFDRWTVQSWQTPFSYLDDLERSDIFWFLTYIKSAADGHMSPITDNSIPELGAPNPAANWNDFPLVEKPLMMSVGLLARCIGLFPAANLALCFAQVLAAVSFYTAARWLRCSWPWAMAGGIVFAFSRYAYSHGIHHLTVEYFWAVPLGLVVCEWIARGSGLEWGGRRFITSLVIAVITGVQHVYYTFLFVQLAFLGGLYQAWIGGWRRILPAAAVIGAAVAGFLLMNLNTFLYQLQHGAGHALVRPYRWLEVYGLKLVDLVVPPPDHPFPPFASWGDAHLHEVLLSPGELPDSAYLGLVGLAALGWLVFVSWQKVMRRQPLPLEAYLILYIIIFAGVGGLNGILGSIGFQLIRSTTRYSLYVLCIALFFALRRISAMEWANQKWAIAVAAALALFAWWEQSPPWVTDAQIAQIARGVQSDRDFVADLEKQLPDGAMVFQLPVMDFPESAVPGVGSSDHFRPYLFAHHLRFSFGTDKGRDDSAWMDSMTNLPPDVMLDDVIDKGFAAIYINREGYADGGAALIKLLQSKGYTTIINSERADLLAVILKK